MYAAHHAVMMSHDSHTLKPHVVTTRSLIITMEGDEFCLVD